MEASKQALPSKRTVCECCWVVHAVCVDVVWRLDPDSSKCDLECGAVTASNVARHVACRQQCVVPDFIGLCGL